MFRILGIRQEINIEEKIENILCIIENRNFYELRNNKLIQVKKFLGLTHISIKKLFVDIDLDENNNVISTNYNINLSTDFKSTNRAFKKRPVWIFYGASGLGKSFIGNLITEYGYLSVYETDISEILPKEFSEDIIIIGNKYKFEIEDIKERLNNRKIILVNFNTL